MTLPLWGSLQKSQDDTETIEQAIARLIAVHEADSDSHLGTGESLEAHKTEDVIDHPAGSVLADKWTLSELEFTTTFENLSAFFTDGVVDPLWPGFTLEPDGTLYANRGELQVDGESGALDIYFANEQLFQFIFSADIASDGEVYLQMGNISSSTFKRGMGLQVIGTTATFYASNDGGTAFNTLSFGTFNALQTYIVRMHYDPVTELISCYVDGVLVGTLAWPDTPPTGYAVIRFLGIKPTTSKPVLQVKSLYFKTSP